MRAFTSQKDFEQAAIDWTARLVSEKASKTISTGNIADIGQQTLIYLEQVALANDLTSSTINVYTDIIAEHNQELLNIFDQ